LENQSKELVSKEVITALRAIFRERKRNETVIEDCGVCEGTRFHHFAGSNERSIHHELHKEDERIEERSQL
jgi:hypothetical protein